MTPWPVALLDEVCEINPRANGADVPAPDIDVTFVPMAAVNERTGRLEGTQVRAASSVSKGYSRFREGDVLFAKITPCMENGKAAIARELSGAVGYGSTEFHVLRPHARLLPEWLLAFIRRPVFRRAAARSFTGTAGQQRVPADFLRQVEIPLPPLAEQRRLVASLGQADALQELGDRADALSQRICESAYLELVDSRERAGWRTIAIEDLLAKGRDSIRTGPFGSQLRHSEFTALGIPVLGIDNVVANRFRWTVPRCISQERFEELRRFEVFGGDVLITIMGTVGRCCVAPADLPRCISTKHLCVLTVDRDVVDPTFVWGALLFDPDVRQQTSAAGGGAIMKGWNSTIIRRLTLRLPPREVQTRLAEVVTEVRGLEEIQASRRARLEELFESLRERAIGGGL